MSGRQRFGDVRMLNRADGVKPIISSLRKGGLLYLLPDMDFGRNDSVFVPFFGVNAATIPSLSRFARLGRAKVLGMYTRMTPTGYVAEITPAWTDFPTDDAEADTARMNREVGQYHGRKIHQIDPDTGAVLRTLQSNRFVTGVTWVDGQLWHGTWEEGQSDLRRLDPDSGAVLQRLEMPAGTGVSGLESDGGDRFFCGGGESGRIRAVRRPRQTQQP